MTKFELVWLIPIGSRCGSDGLTADRGDRATAMMPARVLSRMDCSFARALQARPAVSTLLPQSARTHSKATSVLNMCCKMTPYVLGAVGSIVGLVTLDATMDVAMEKDLLNDLCRPARASTYQRQRRKSLRSHACDETIMDEIMDMIVMSGKLEAPSFVKSLWLPKETLVKRRCNAKKAVDNVRRELAQQPWGAVLEDDVLVCFYLLDSPATRLVLWMRGIDSSGFYSNTWQVAIDCAVSHLAAQEK